MDQAISRGDELAPWNVGPAVPDSLGNVAGCFPDQFQIAQGSVVVEPAADESRLIESLRLGQHRLCERDHVVDVEDPGPPLAAVRHEWPPAPRRAGARGATPCR